MTRTTRNSTKTNASNGLAKKTKGGTKGVAKAKTVPKSKEYIEDSGDDGNAFQTPPPRLPATPKTPPRNKRKHALHSPESALQLEPAPSPSPTKRLRSMTLNSPQKTKATTATNKKAKGSATVAQKKAATKSKPTTAKANTKSVQPKTNVKAKGKPSKAPINVDSSEEDDYDDGEEEYDEDDEDDGDDDDDDDDDSEDESEEEEEEEEEDEVTRSEEEVNKDEDDDESEEEGEEDGSVDEDDPFSTLGKDGKPNNAKRNLSDKRNIRVKDLPDKDGIPASVYDEQLLAKAPSTNCYHLELGQLNSWKTKNTDEQETLKLTSLAFYKSFTKGKRIINNIVNALSFGEDMPFYNAANADPRKYVARFLPSQMLTQYELVDGKKGMPVVGITVGAFVRSTLVGPVPEKDRYRVFVIIPHRGVYERFASFHCMTFGVDALVGQRDGNLLSFQTRNKPDDKDFKKKAEGSGDDSDEEKVFDGLESYDSPQKKPAQKQSAARRHLSSSYKFDEEVPILDGRGVKLEFSAKGLYDHLDQLPKFTDKLTMRSPCLVGYNTYGYIYQEEWRVKFNVLFVIVLDVAPKK
ncbi:hypothetical protein NMY22_g7668 [Coprinellus aureogranulatus]|nr:hypothetical protein NMY22_g7668 [Coprinellus aureogranulatus]